MSEKENINLQLQGSQVNLYERPRNMSGRASTRSMSVKKFRPKRPMSAMPALGNQVNITINDLRDCRRPQSADNPCHADVNSCLSSSQQTLENETASEVCGSPPFVGHKSKLAAKFSLCRKSLEIQDVKVVNINIESVPPNTNSFSVETYDLTDEESLGEQIMALAQNNGTPPPSPVISQEELQKREECHLEWIRCEENSAQLILTQPEDVPSSAKQSDAIDENAKVSEGENEISTEVDENGKVSEGENEISTDVANSSFYAEFEETSSINITDSQEIQKDSSSLKVQHGCPPVENEAKSMYFFDEYLPSCKESSSNELPVRVSDKCGLQNLTYSEEINKHQEQNHVKGKTFSDKRGLQDLPYGEEINKPQEQNHVKGKTFSNKRGLQNLPYGEEINKHQEPNHVKGKTLSLDIEEEEDRHLVCGRHFKEHFEDDGGPHTNAWMSAEDFGKPHKPYAPSVPTIEEKIKELTVGKVDTDDRQLDSKKFSYNKQSGSRTNKTSGKLKDILTFLSEAEDSVNDSQEHIVVSKLTTTTKSSACAYELNFKAIPRLEELKDLSTMELAHQVLTLQLQLEDREHSLDLMRHTLAEQRELALSSSQRMEKDVKARLHEHKKEYEIIINRHQKFIDQLINEKKSLTEKCESLVKELKASEDRHQSNLKASEERHRIELQKAREMHAAAEKLRRERWIDQKTKKIKEMTVKGLEPELQRMASRHQQELSDLRSLHKQELEELETRAARKSSQQVEKVREEMESQQRELLERERESQRERFDKQIEEIEKSHQEQRQRLLAEVCREKESLVEKEANIRREVEDYKMQLQKSKLKEVDSMKKEYEEAANNMARKYQNELKALHEAYEEEKEIWVHNFKKEQNALLYERESEIRDHYKKEQDREIELIIHRFEEESSRAKLEQEQVTENRIKRMQEKFSAEMRDLEASERAYKDKWNETKSKLTETEDEMIALRAAIRQLESEIAEAHKITDRLSVERANMKEIIRDEFSSQISDMEREILRLREAMSEMKANHQMDLTLKDKELEMARAEKEKELHEVYDRVKCTINKKHKTIQQLKIQNQSVLERCEHLEQLLEQQRRDYLLK